MNKTKKQIFDAAIKLFAESGYEKATMDDIAAQASVAKGTLYYYFKSKEDIFNFLVEEGIKTLKEHIEESIKGMDNPIDKLKEIVKIQAEMINKYNKFIIFLLSQLWGTHERQVKFRQYIFGYMKIISDVLDEAKAQKMIIDEESNMMAVGFFGMISSAMIYKMMDEGNYDSEYLASALIRHSMTGLQNKG